MYFRLIPGSLSLEDGTSKTVQRADIAEIRLIEYVGNGRRRGKFLGGAIGLLGGLVGAVAIGMNETSANKDRDKTLAAVLAVAGLPIGLLLGYFLGRQADKEITVIQIIPQ